MKLVLDIRILAGMNVQQFVIPLDLTGPATLRVKPGALRQGNEISILDDRGEQRVWFANEIHGLYFEAET